MDGDSGARHAEVEDDGSVAAALPSVILASSSSAFACSSSPRTARPSVLLVGGRPGRGLGEPGPGAPHPRAAVGSLAAHADASSPRLRPPLSLRRRSPLAPPYPAAGVAAAHHVGLPSASRHASLPCASRRAASLPTPNACGLAPSPRRGGGSPEMRWEARRKEGGEGGARAGLWRRRERGEGGGVARGADWARVFIGKAIYMDAVKKNERPRFVVRHDPTAGKFGFTWWPVGVAPYIRLRCHCNFHKLEKCHIPSYMPFCSIRSHTLPLYTHTYLYTDFFLPVTSPSQLVS
jgi:hypothetical protein